MRTLTIVSAGLSTPSSTQQLADALAAATSSRVGGRGEGVDLHQIQLRELATEMASALTSPAAHTPALDAARRQLAATDALIAATPVFQGSYSGLFKMFFDLLDVDTLTGVPTLIAATGGTPRHALMLDYALRPLFNHLHALVVPTGVFQATQDFGTQEGARIQERINRAAQQLSDLLVAPRDRVGGLAGPTDAQGAQPRPTGLDLEEDFQPFSALLKGLDGTPGHESGR